LGAPQRAGAQASSADVARNRDAIARVAVAEAGDQGDSGLAAVIFVILNRLRMGRWGVSVDAVLNAPGQFEPVMRAGGDWRRLRPPTPEQRAHVDTILNLAVDGRLPDLTRGAAFFQNPAVVAARARSGVVSPTLVNFGGLKPLVVIGAHAFFADEPRLRGEGPRSRGEHGIFGGPLFAGAPAERKAPWSGRRLLPDSPQQGLFVTPSGDVVVALGPFAMMMRGRRPEKAGR